MYPADVKFKNLFKHAIVSYGLILPIFLLTIITCLLWVFSPEYFRPDAFWIWVSTFSVMGIVVGVHYKYINNLSRNQLKLIYIIYHLAFFFFCIFVAPYLSSLNFFWVLLSINIALVFGRRWFLLTLSVCTLTFIITGVLSTNISNILTIFNTAIFIIWVASITIFVSKFHGISDQERHLFNNISRDIALEKQQLSVLINSMGEAVIAFDHSGKITLYNAQALNLLDINTNLEGKNINQVLKLKNLNNKRVSTIAMAHKTQTNFSSEEYSHFFNNDESVKLYINISVIKSDFGENGAYSYILVLRDITDKKSLEDERDEFISVVSHELRTPVAIAEGSLSNAVFFAQKDNATETTKNALGQAHDKILLLAEMVNDLATLSRAERSNYETEIKQLDVAEFIEHLQKDYSSQAQEKGLELSANITDNLGKITVAELYLREILQNFITNAIKYTKKGNIIIHARKTENKIVFSVSDSGIGMSKNDAKHVYDKFWRSESYETRESSGTGLGLYVTNKIALKINSTLGLESELGKGSTFSVTVPVTVKVDKP